MIGDLDSSCQILQPDADYQLAVPHSCQEAEKDGLLEDEYEHSETSF